MCAQSNNKILSQFPVFPADFLIPTKTVHSSFNRTFHIISRLTGFIPLCVGTNKPLTPSLSRVRGQSVRVARLDRGEGVQIQPESSEPPDKQPEFAPDTVYNGV